MANDARCQFYNITKVIGLCLRVLYAVLGRRDSNHLSYISSTRMDLCPINIDPLSCAIRFVQHVPVAQIDLQGVLIPLSQFAKQRGHTLVDYYRYNSCGRRNVCFDAQRI